MPHFVVDRSVAHSAGDMFDLVADVESYPQFLPLCERLIVKGRKEEGSRLILVADMTVAYGPFRETLTTQVNLDRAARVINAAYLDGPFHHLDSRWAFTPTGARSCDIRFTIEYEFKSRMLGAVVGSVFDAAFRKFASAFEARADAVYGTAPGA